MGKKLKFSLLYCFLGLLGFLINLIIESPMYILRIIVSVLVGLVIGTISEFSIRKIHFKIKSVIIKAAILSTITTSLLMIFQVYILKVDRGVIAVWYYLLMFIGIFIITYLISKYQIKRDEYLQSKLDEFKKSKNKE